jgi:hypothetical protein
MAPRKSKRQPKPIANDRRGDLTLVSTTFQTATDTRTRRKPGRPRKTPTPTDPTLADEPLNSVDSNSTTNPPSSLVHRIEEQTRLSTIEEEEPTLFKSIDFDRIPSPRPDSLIEYPDLLARGGRYSDAELVPAATQNSSKEAVHYVGETDDGTSEGDESEEDKTTPIDWMVKHNTLLTLQIMTLQKTHACNIKMSVSECTEWRTVMCLLLDKLEIPRKLQDRVLLGFTYSKFTGVPIDINNQAEWTDILNVIGKHETLHAGGKKGTQKTTICFKILNPDVVSLLFTAIQ